MRKSTSSRWPDTEFIVPVGPKFVKIDPKTNTVSKVFPFGTDVAPQRSYLNDLRFSPDGRFANITDSGATGALVVVDLTTGKGAGCSRATYPRCRTKP